MYNNINLKSIKKSNINKYLDKNLVDKLLYETILEFPFSTFPYIHGVNSKGCQKYKQGNCVALAINLRKKLKKYNIKSILIPCSIPKKYQHEGYIHLSHCAVAILDELNNILICDPAFYFLESAYLNFNKITSNTILSKNIYDNKLDTNVFNLKIIKKLVNFNKYQSIPDNTYLVNMFFKDDPNDSWNYYLIQILNPDEAISNFFINIKRLPFITILDNKLTLSFLLKYTDKSTFYIKYYGKLIYKGIKSNIPESIKPIIKNYLGNDWINSIYMNPSINKKQFNIKDNS
tara:strand:+ start:797 stop:1663 length:867 start_codon:yes stop_codon:yes gene_type:complete